MKMMTTARMAGARLIHFPESGLSGYVKAQIADWADVDWSLLDNELANICDDAGKLGIWVALGANHNLGEHDRSFNSLYVISDVGDVHTTTISDIALTLKSQIGFPQGKNRSPSKSMGFDLDVPFASKCSFLNSLLNMET